MSDSSHTVWIWRNVTNQSHPRAVDVGDAYEDAFTVARKMGAISFGYGAREGVLVTASGRIELQVGLQATFSNPDDAVLFKLTCGGK